MIFILPRRIKKFLDFSISYEVYEEESDINMFISEITGRKVGIWPSKLRVLVSLLTVKYNILFRLGIYNWFPTTHNSNFLKNMAMLLHVIGTATKFGKGYFIYQYIVKDVGSISSSTLLYFLFQFTIRKTIDLPTTNTSLESFIIRLFPFTSGSFFICSLNEEEYGKLLEHTLEGITHRQKLFAEEFFDMPKRKAHI